MKDAVLIRGARQLLTLNGPPGPRRGASLRNPGLIEDGSVLIVSGTIASVGPTRRIENLTEAKKADVIDAVGMVVIPGFVDSHLELMHDTAIPFAPEGRSTAHYTLRTLDQQAHRVLRACVKHGTTTLEGRCISGFDANRNWKMLRAAAALSGETATVVPVFGAPEQADHTQPLPADRWMDRALLQRIAAKKIAQYAAVRCGETGLPAAALPSYIEECRRHELLLKLGICDPVPDACITTALACEPAVVEGLNYASRSQVQALAGSPSLAVLMPGTTVAGRTAAYPPARALLDSGGAVALASGYRHGEASMLSMQTVIGLACSQLGMQPAEALAAATLNGACALGLENRIGSLQYGKEADLVILNIPDYRELATGFGANMVAFTIKKGRVVYHESEVM